jgi:hypothetical protein
MVSDQTRNAIWQELLDVARLVRYYEALADRHRRLHRIIRFLLLAAAASGVVTLLNLLPVLIQSLAGGLIALLVVWDVLGDYARKAAVLHAISLECSHLEVEWQNLWGELETISDTEARRRNTSLAQRIAEITGWAGHADIRDDPKLNEQSAEAAYQIMASRHAT